MPRAVIGLGSELNTISLTGVERGRNREADNMQKCLIDTIIFFYDSIMFCKQVNDLK